MTSVFIGTIIPIAMIVALVIAATIVIVASRDEHTAAERRNDNRKNEDVFHGFSRLNVINWIRTRLRSAVGCQRKDASP